MNARDLRKLLDAEGFNPQVYSLEGGDGWEIECMSPDSGGWSVCHRERGRRTAMSWFPTEAEACEEMLRRLRRWGELRWSHLPVNKGLLKRMLDEERFFPEVYSLDGGLEDGRHCLSAEGGRWCVYCVSDGQRVNERWFESEGDACGELLRRLRALPGPESRRQLRARPTPKDKSDLKEILDAEKIEPILYSLAGDLEGRYCLTAEGGRWCVHYVIEGQRIHERWFESEGDACADILWRLCLPLRLKELPGDRCELKRMIDEGRFYPTVYNLDGDIEGRLCLSAEGGKWSLYYVEDGRRADERWFESEQVACAEFLWRLRELRPKLGARIDPGIAKDWQRWGRALSVVPPAREIAGARDVYPAIDELIAELERAGSSQPAAILQYRMRHVRWGAGPEHFQELRHDLSRALRSQDAVLPEPIKARMRRLVEVIDADTEERKQG